MKDPFTPVDYLMVPVVSNSSIANAGLARTNQVLFRSSHTHVAVGTPRIDGGGGRNNIYCNYQSNIQ